MRTKCLFKVFPGCECAVCFGWAGMSLDNAKQLCRGPAQFSPFTPGALLATSQGYLYAPAAGRTAAAVWAWLYFGGGDCLSGQHVGERARGSRGGSFCTGARCQALRISSPPDRIQAPSHSNVKVQSLRFGFDLTFCTIEGFIDYL